MKSALTVQETAQILLRLPGGGDRTASALQPSNCSSSALASFKSAVSKPSVNQP